MKPLEIPNLSMYVTRYEAGESSLTLAGELGVKGETLTRRFKQLGVKIRNYSECQEVIIPNLEQLISDYKRGESVNALSQKTGIERGVLTRRFRLAGVSLRNQSRAEKLKWKQYKGDNERVKTQLQKAWNSSRGRTDTYETKVQRANTRHSKQLQIFTFESEIANVLRQKGCNISQQYPVGQFNLDIAFSEIKLAVEITNSGWEGSRRMRECKRAEYILNQGWCILYVKTYNGTGRNKRAVLHLGEITDFIIEFTERVNEDGSLLGKYAVVRGDCVALHTRTSTLEGLPKIYNL
jgi:very-short-patch-repair endonuclease